MRYTISCANAFFDILYSHGIFLPANDALKASTAAIRVCASRLTYVGCKFFIFIYLSDDMISPKLLHPLPCRVALASKEGYTQLASLAYLEGRKLYKLRPKLHMMYELALQLTPDDDGGHVLSPVATCCWSDEDFIGKVSRVARRCHGATQSIGAMRKTLGMYRLQFTKCRQATSKAMTSR